MCYSDSDWGGNLVDKKRTTGAAFIFKLGIVSWIYKKKNKKWLLYHQQKQNMWPYVEHVVRDYGSKRFCQIVE